jgi:hypothetical protein
MNIFLLPLAMYGMLHANGLWALAPFYLMAKAMTFFLFPFTLIIEFFFVLKTVYGSWQLKNRTSQEIRNAIFVTIAANATSFISMFAWSFFMGRFYFMIAPIHTMIFHLLSSLGALMPIAFFILMLGYFTFFNIIAEGGIIKFFYPKTPIRRIIIWIGLGNLITNILTMIVFYYYGQL